MLIAALLVPAGLPAPAAVAAPAGDSLMVTTVARDGAVESTLTTVVNLASKRSYEVRSGVRRALPRGTYAVVAGIRTPSENTQTLGATIVNVTGNATATLDARQGVPLSVSLTPAPAADHYQLLQATICLDGREWHTYGSAGPGQVYLIPHSSKRLRLGYSSSWTSEATPGEAFMVLGGTVALPSRPEFAFTRAGLATVDIRARRGPGGVLKTGILVGSAETDCRAGHRNSLGAVVAPATVTAHLSPGRWDVEAQEWTDRFGVGSWTKTRTLAAGKRYTQAFFQAAWGPASVPYVVRGDLRFPVDRMFRDPGFGGELDYEEGQKTLVTLKRGSRTVARKTLTDQGSDREFDHFMAGAAGWYTLTAQARRHRSGVRYPAGMLSTAATATFRFRADPAKSLVAPVFVTRFIPAGLDMNNRARPRSTTQVTLRLERLRADPRAKLGRATAKTVTAKASFDGGKTWRSVRVKRVGKGWAAVVANPVAGAVSLRAKVTDGKGNSSEITIYRAYAIG
jgi:hypothetical protein